MSIGSDFSRSGSPPGNAPSSQEVDDFDTLVARRLAQRVIWARTPLLVSGFYLLTDHLYRDIDNVYYRDSVYSVSDETACI